MFTQLYTRDQEETRAGEVEAPCGKWGSNTQQGRHLTHHKEENVPEGLACPAALYSPSLTPVLGAPEGSLGPQSTDTQPPAGRPQPGVTPTRRHKQGV